MEVRWLIIRSDVMYADFLSLNVVSKVMESDVQVLRPRPVLVYFGHLQSTAIVFKYVAVHSRLWSVNRKTLPLHLLQQLYNWYRISQCIA